jgi:hypothetical protein
LNSRPLCMFWMLLLFPFNSLQRFPPILWNVSSLGNCFLWWAEVLIWCNPICQFLLGFPGQLGSCSESSCLCLDLQVFTFSSFSFRSYIESFDTFWIDFCTG